MLRWSAGGDTRVRRLDIIRSLKRLGVIMTTTPNYSLFVDVPRHVDLHAIKRIGLVHAEFLQEGLPAALHINGRTETDFRRWCDYVRSRPEVTHLAYEFTTGTGRAARRLVHAEWLAGVAEGAGRPLDLIMRGGIDLLPRLTTAFNRVTVLETWSFMKTMQRQWAVPCDAGAPRWRRSPTPIGQPLDTLFAWNRSAVCRWIERQVHGLGETSSEVVIEAVAGRLRTLTHCQSRFQQALVRSGCLGDGAVQGLQWWASDARRAPQLGRVAQSRWGSGP